MPTSIKRAARELKFLRTRLGRVIRDINRKVAGNEELQQRLAPLIDLAIKVRRQTPQQRGHKVADTRSMPCMPPEVECIVKGKAKVRCPTSSVARSRWSPRSRNPRAGSLSYMPQPCTAIPSTVIFECTIKGLEASTGVTVQRIHVDRGYRGHDYPNRFKV